MGEKPGLSKTKRAYHVLDFLSRACIGGLKPDKEKGAHSADSTITPEALSRLRDAVIADAVQTVSDGVNRTDNTLARDVAAAAFDKTLDVLRQATEAALSGENEPAQQKSEYPLAAYLINR